MNVTVIHKDQKIKFPLIGIKEIKETKEKKGGNESDVDNSDNSDNMSVTIDNLKRKIDNSVGINPDDIIIDINEVKPVIPVDSSKLAKSVGSKITVFGCDNIFELKEKIFMATGIEVYKQHLYIKSYRVIPMFYRIFTDHDIEIDISKKTEEQTYGLPIDIYLYREYQSITIEALDQMYTVADIWRDYGITEYHLESVDDWIVDKAKFSNLIQDGTTSEIIYNGFILKYWPMMTKEIFSLYLNGGDIESQYTDLAPSNANLEKVFSKQDTILKEIYKSNPPKLNSYISKVYMIVKDPGLHINIRMLFEMISCSEQIPLMKLHTFIEGRFITLTKVWTNDAILQPAYDKYRMRINMTYINSILFLVDITRNKSGKTKINSGRTKVNGGKNTDNDNETGDNDDKSINNVSRTTDNSSASKDNVGRTTNFSNTSKDYSSKPSDYSDVSRDYGIFIIKESGDHELRVYHDKEVEVSFETIFEEIGTVNALITKINELGRKVFNVNGTLKLITRHDSEITNLSINIIWNKQLNDTEFNGINQFIKTEAESQMITTADPNTFYMRKGITQWDQSELDVPPNHYSYLSDQDTKQKWYKKFPGRYVSFTNKTTDIKITVEDIHESEYELFTYYIDNFLKRFDKYVVPTKEKILTFKNQIRVLKSLDPDLFDFKISGSNVVYSRICQKEHQPVMYNESEYKLLKKTGNAVKFWNFTNQKPVYYVCPNKKYPHISFITGQHPKNYCIPCCKKTETKQTENKKDVIFDICLTNYIYDESSLVDEYSRYIMNYGKLLDIGRLGHLPELLARFIVYNVKTDELDTWIHNGQHYSISNIRHVVSNNKIYMINIHQLIKTNNNGSTTINDKKTKVNKGEQKKTTVNDTKTNVNDTKTNVNGGKLPKTNINSGKTTVNSNKLLKTNVKRLQTVNLSNVLIFDDVMITPIELIQKYELMEYETVPVIYVTESQLEKSLNEKSKEQNLNKSGLYIYGVPQNTENLNSIGTLFSLSTCLGITEEEFISDVIKWLGENKIVFPSLLNGKIMRYYNTLEDLVKDIKNVFQGDGKYTQFNKWNELFIELTKYVWGKWVITYMDETIDTTGTNIKNITATLHVYIPSVISNPQSVFDDDYEYIFLLSKKKKSKNIFNIERYYYPFVMSTPHDFFRNKKIDKYIHTKYDLITELTKQILGESTRDKSINVDEDISKFAEHLGVSVKYYQNLKGHIHGVKLGDVSWPIKYFKSQSVTAVIEPLPHDTNWKNIVDTMEAWSKYFKTKIEIRKLHVLIGKPSQIIAFESDLIYYFKPVLAISSNFTAIWARIARIISPDVTNYSELVHFIRYNPALINGKIKKYYNGEIKAEIPQRFKETIKNQDQYDQYVHAFISYLDRERDTERRKELIKQIEKGEEIADLTETDMAIVRTIQSAYRMHYSRTQLLKDIETSIFDFDHMILIKLRELTNIYAGEDTIKNVFLQFVDKINKQIIKQHNNLKDLDFMAQLLFYDFINPLKREYLVSSIIIKKVKNYFRFQKNPDEEIYLLL